MRTQIISGFNWEGYELYGRNFLYSFDQHWPEQVKLAVYVEGPVSAPTRVAQRSLWDIPGCREFIVGYGADPRFNGRAPVPGWRGKDHRAKYAWRFDAVRFCRQLFIPEHAVNKLRDGDVFAWLDADVVTYDTVPNGFIKGLLDHRDLVYLGRKHQATELGFWAIEVNPKTRRFVKKLADVCRSGEIFKMDEWHSGYVWDRIREKSDLFEHSLTNKDGHVWFETDLGLYTDHLKGNQRKARGWSVERKVKRKKEQCACFNKQE